MRLAAAALLTALCSCSSPEPYAGQASSDLEGSLYSAIVKDQYEMVLFLIKRGANLNARDDDGWTPLIRCIQDKRTSFDRNYFGKRFEIAAALVENGAALNDSDNDGMTPLMWAINEHQDEIAKLLIARGAKLDLVNSDGQTALNLAILANNDELAHLIVESRNNGHEPASNHHASAPPNHEAE